MTTVDSTAPPPTEGGPAGAEQIRNLIRRRQLQAKRIPDEAVRGPRDQHMTRKEAEEQAHLLKTRIDADEIAGSLRHRTVGRRTKVLSLVFLVLIDFPVMLWLVSSVFNVDWADPIGLPLMISVVLSVLGTAGAAWVLYHMGHNRRDDKDDRRRLNWFRMSMAGKVSLAGVGTLVTLISVVMFVRVFTEGLLSGLSSLALLLAVLIALIMLLSAALVFFTAVRDGSSEQEDLAHYSALVHEGRERLHAIEDEIEHLRHQLHMLAYRPTPEHGADGHLDAADPSTVNTADQPTSSGVATDTVADEDSASDAQVTRIHERRPPHPPRSAAGAPDEPVVGSRPLT